MPEKHEWGPLYWKLLHGMAEYSGKFQSIILQNDERAYWKKLLTTLEGVLPCKECRQHAHEYILTHPVQIPDDPADVHTYIKMWLYEFHEDVNRRLGKPSFPYTRRGRETSLLTAFSQLDALLSVAIHPFSFSHLSWKKWANTAKILLNMYS